MIQKWRPEDWPEILQMACKQLFSSGCGSVESRQIEAGADAILKALREMGTHYSAEHMRKINGKVKHGEGTGTYVFIPDDNQEH